MSRFAACTSCRAGTESISSTNLQPANGIETKLQSRKHPIRLQNLSLPRIVDWYFFSIPGATLFERIMIIVSLTSFN